MKKICLLVIVSIMAAMLSACGGETEKEEDRNNLEFTVVSEDRLPDELKEILDQKKESAFKLTYADEGYLYICVGYGKQESGGYSVTVKDVYKRQGRWQVLYWYMQPVFFRLSFLSIRDLSKGYPVKLMKRRLLTAQVRC